MMSAVIALASLLWLGTLARLLLSRPCKPTAMRAYTGVERRLHPYAATRNHLE